MNHHDIHDLERAVRANARWTTALIVLIVAVLVGGGAYGYGRVKQFLQPRNVAGEAEQFIRTHYPEWRAEVKQELVKHAPALAEKLSRRAVESIPDARARIEQRLEVAIDQGLAQAKTIGAEELREFVRKNRKEIRQAYAEARQTPEEARQAVVQLETRLEKELDVNVQKEARQALQWIDAFNARLRELAKTSEPADEAERAAQRVVRLLRALQVREVGKLGPQGT